MLFSRYNYNRDVRSVDTGLACGEPTRTKQSFIEECDINTIVKRFGVTGNFPVPERLPSYEDFSEVIDYHTAANAIASARESFDALPADLRARFHNDPGSFVDFCSSDANRAEAIKLGLIAKPDNRGIPEAAAAPLGAPGAPVKAAEGDLGSQA